MANDKQPYILLSLYQNLYKEKYGKMPTMNKFREKWAMQDCIDSIGFDRAKELIEYYFKLNKSGHQLQFFFYNFDRIDNVKRDSEADVERRRLLLEQTKKMVERGGIE